MSFIKKSRGCLALKLFCHKENSFTISRITDPLLYLLIRLYQQRANINKRSGWSILQRIGIRMSIYVIWSCLYYCPISFYNLSLIIDSSKYSPDLKSTMNITNTVIVQSYPILTFISMLIFSRRKQAQTKKESDLKLNNISTITPIQPNDN